MEQIWDKQSVEKAVSIIKDAESKKTKRVIALDKSVYWMALIVVIIGNFAVSIMLIPILLALRSFGLYLSIVVLGIGFGFLFDSLIRDMANLEKKHHVIAGFYVPIIAIINLYVITTITNSLEFTSRLNNEHSLLFVGFSYAIAFVLPYIYYNYVKKG